ncbi:MAG: Rieske (2Fe-2S) protein [Acidimicrobiales bacterium]|nr:Rieske (2Fe-2S) protein [Acidimicrobiales bacterium]
MADSAELTVPARRYSERQYVFEENEHVWRKAWLLVGSTDHVAEPGDYVEARFGLAPTMVVRGDDGRLRGFENVCQHQGAPLCLGAGGGLTQIECQNHRWAWDLAGRLQAVDFGAAPSAGQEIPLTPLVVETWGPFVFASFDPGIGPLADDIATLATTLDDAGIDPDGLRCRSVVSTLTGGNWKSLLDGVSAVGDVPDLGARQLPDLAVRADASTGTVTIVRVRPYVSIDRAVFDVLVFEPRPEGAAAAGPRPLDVTLKKDDEVPADSGVDPALIAYARNQLGAVPPTEDLVVDPSAAPDLAALHAWLDERLPSAPAG